MSLNTSDAEMAALQKGLACGKLVLKLAESDAERTDVFKLRYEVFNEELGEGLPESALTGLDQDNFDRYCDHLMVISDKQVIGTYRLLHGPLRPPSGFYSETEYNISGLSLDPSQIVELGRGCIRPEFRKQTTLISLFWGLHRYMMARKARYLMGCASLAIMSNDSAEATLEQLRQMGKVDDLPNVHPHENYKFSGDASEGIAAIPPLVGFYLQFGARVIGRPAFDPVFRCHDLLMLFDMDHLSPWGMELINRFDRRLAQNTNASNKDR